MRTVSTPRVSLGSFILGIVITIMVFHAYTVYQIRTLALQNQANIAQIASVLQQALSPQQAVPAQQQAAPQQAVPQKNSQEKPEKK